MLSSAGSSSADRRRDGRLRRAGRQRQRREVLGNAQLELIARELVQKAKENVTIDWTIKENVRARIRILVRRVLKKWGYPPDLQEAATLTVLEQAEVLCAEWAA
jgi:type I restriction enzyme R subunit